MMRWRRVAAARFRADGGLAALVRACVRIGATRASRRLLGAVLGLVGSVLTVPVQVALAETYVVDTTTDNGNLTTCSVATNDCSLRGAIRKANTTPGWPHVITVPAGTYTLTGTPNEDNGATGDLDVLAPMTIAGAGAQGTVVQAGTTDENGVDRVFDVIAGTVTISGMTIQHGTRFTAEDGGGVRVRTGATSTIADALVRANDARDGGGIANEGALTVLRSTLSQNSAVNRGGGVVVLAGAVSTALTNVTLAGNVSGGLGHGLAQAGTGATTSVNNATVTGDGGFAGIPAVSVSQGIISFANSVIAADPRGGVVSNCSQGSPGQIVSGGHNLSTTPQCGFAATGDIQGQPALLGPLQLNGGQTPTHAFLGGSPAIDAGNPGTPGSGGGTCAATDQRGLGRPQDGVAGGPVRCDIGAFETHGTLAVDRTDDATVFLCTPAPNDCALRGAIQFLNGVGGGAITVSAGTYTLTLGGAGEDNGATGDLDVRATMAITGAGARSTIIQAGGALGAGIDRVLDVVAGTLTLSGVTVRHGTVGTGEDGAGIRVLGGAAATITDASVTRNRAGFGGGISNRSTLTLARSTVSGNESVPASGGGIYSGGTTVVANVTVHGNTASIGASGLYQSPTGGTQLTNVTIVGNTSAAQPGIGAGLVSDSNVTVANSIVAGNRLGAAPSNCQLGFQIGALITSAGYNLSDSNECPFTATGDVRGQDPRLGPLQNNGGQTDTLMPLAGSPAAETGNPAGPLDAQGGRCLPGDQRGVARPIDGDADGAGRCDKGAVEAPVCTAVRPRVRLTVVRGGPNELQVTLTAGFGGISRVRGIAGRSSNVAVDVNGQSGLSPGFDVAPAGGPSSLPLTLRRTSGAGSGTLSLIVTDACGDWPTLVGGGPNAW
jgi:hypothetical protein